jgi:protein SCO1/2
VALKRTPKTTRVTLLLCVALGWASVLLVSSEASARKEEPPLEIGLTEHLGAGVAKNLRFVSLVYYTCPSICRPLLTEVADMLGKLQAVDMQPGRDYRMLTISFDQTDSPAGSTRLKDEYYRMLPDGFPRDSWTFLTADSATIAAFTQSVGFGFKRAEKDFAHPTTLVVLSPEGKITRYLTGSEYLPLDIKMALIEAREGKVGATIVKFYKFCFSYDPSGEKFVLNTTRIVGLSTLAGVAGIVLFVTASSRRREKKVQ